MFSIAFLAPFLWIRPAYEAQSVDITEEFVLVSVENIYTLIVCPYPERSHTVLIEDINRIVTYTQDIIGRMFEPGETAVMAIKLV